MLDVCLLGSGGGMPMPNRRLSATLLNYEGRKILFDCGEGTQVAMRELGWGFKSLDLICITHSHGDHTVGIPGLLATLGNSGREEPLTIIGPRGITEVITGLRVIAKYLPYEINIMEAPESVEFVISKQGIEVKDDNNKLNRGEFIIKTLELEHSDDCIGYSIDIKRRRKFDVESAEKNNVPKILWSRLQKEENVLYNDKEYNCDLVLGSERKGIKLSLITDTRPIDVIPSFIKDSSLFICEGTYGDDSDVDKAVKYKHMTFREAARLAKAGEVKKMLLTHFSVSMINPENYIQNAYEEFNDTMLGHDGYIISMNFKD